jgi:hypothetical protein
MQCEEARDELADYLADSLAERAQSELLRHLFSCRACREEAEGLREIWIKGRAMVGITPDSPAIGARFDAMIEAYQGEVQAKRPVHRWPRRWAAQVVFVILMLAVGVFAAQQTGVLTRLHLVVPTIIAPPPPRATSATEPTPPIAVQDRVVPANGALEGVVLDLEDRPIAGAEVTAILWPPPAGPNTEPPLTASSGSNGKFLLRDLAAGGYRIRVQAGGYAWQEFGAAAPGIQGAGTGIVTTVGAGQSLPEIKIRLVREAILTGRVTSTSGSPLVGMNVLALRKTFDGQGWASFKTEGRAVTNDRGEYRLLGLSIGSYYIRAATGPVLMGRDQFMALADGRAVVLPAGPSPGTFTPTYYPGVTDVAKAAPVKLEAAVEVRNIDIALLRSPGFRVRGRVIDPTSSTPPAFATMSITPARTAFVSSIAGSHVAYKPDGTFELTDVAPGTYWVLAQIPGDPRPQHGATLTTVIDSDVNDVEVTIVRDVTVTGSVTVEDRSVSDAELAAIRVELRRVLAGQISPPISGLTMGSNGTFTYKNLPVAEFRLTLSGLPPDLYVRVGRIAGVDALTQFVDLTKPQTAPLEIVLAKGTEVRGTVIGDASQPLPSQHVVLIPKGLRDRPDLYKTAHTDAMGRFSIQGVAPGNYKAFAWKAIESYRYFDSEFMRDFDHLGTPVSVEGSVVSTTNLRLIP